MDILFPRISINVDFEVIDRRSKPRDYIGNPKAVAAQTFKARKTALRLYDKKPWVGFCHLFSIQYHIESSKIPVIMTPSHDDWILYPYALSRIADECVCLVWREPVEPRWIRHVRVYNDEAQALSDNHKISLALGVSSS